jgi:hypothetical protein
MELRALVGVYEAADRCTVYTSAGGGVVRQRDDIAAVLGVPAAAVRVVSGDVGGNFGIRDNTYPELALVAWEALQHGGDRLPPGAGPEKAVFIDAVRHEQTSQGLAVIRLDSVDKGGQQRKTRQFVRPCS